MEGKTARGASSPAKPAFTSPEPLSHTRAVVSSSSHILAELRRDLQIEGSRAAQAQRRRRCPSRAGRREPSWEGSVDGGGGGDSCQLLSPGAEGWQAAAEIGSWPGVPLCPGARGYGHPVGVSCNCSPFHRLGTLLDRNHTPCPLPAGVRTHGGTDPKRPARPSPLMTQHETS